MFPTFEKIKELCKQRGITLIQLEETLGYSRNTLYKLKTQKPNAERIAEIADYFNVSTDYLLGRTDNPAIANGTPSQKTIDFKEIAAQSMSYDGKPLTDDDIDLIAAVLEQRFKNRD
ncbi:TPA: helix-turn-helix transcriptional regulator [Streptococcus pyogenes]|uniref:Phage DNA-binding protein n=2 Tax=Streptococcus pyogenes TaxID=1314 RepID=A0A7Z2KM25_STRPY|nr:helix-turn-helix transcriptional regulator [Streptococcus pyogenes]QBX23745.1 Cro/CI family transcriptional regulator [Streptococcus phage Javan150]QBX29422.1 Cro/CI family transcriptional regulator [Streptococcus phage Javan494]QBX30226.1 Cro/CI family transcriptional regulator [Streptococcus phage Javan528]HER4585079.1 helix-turn-helix transcriptional regulator [Streptococcus pyogenes NGAS618]HER4606733.1 helix-turn-helix transcriptional regulator [Streptococcus pyogenes NGAS532]HER46121